MTRESHEIIASKKWRKTAGSRSVLVVTGFFLMLVSPIIGALPGPGFIILFPIGLALVLKNSHWAKKRYVRFKQRYPKYGEWADWAMRRQRHRNFPDNFELPLVGKVKASKNENPEVG